MSNPTKWQNNLATYYDAKSKVCTHETGFLKMFSFVVWYTNPYKRKALLDIYHALIVQTFGSNKLSKYVICKQKYIALDDVMQMGDGASTFFFTVLECQELF